MDTARRTLETKLSRRRPRQPAWLLLIVILSVLLIGCSSGGEDKHNLTLITHDSFSLSDDVLAKFTADTGITVEIFRAADAGTMLNQSILAKGNPLGDVLFGVDNTFMSRALAADILEPYESPRLAAIPARLQLDESSRLLPVDVGDVCINYDVGWFDSRDIAPPASLADLADPRLSGQLVVQNPATSSPGLAFMLATIAEFGQDDDYDWLDYWSELRANNVRISPGWTEAYYGDFSFAGGGDRPIVVSYATSPPAEVFFADPRPTEAPTAVVASTCFRQQEFVGILAGTDNREGAELFVDFLLSVEVQEDIPWNMFVFPAASDAQVPAEFLEFSTTSQNPLMVTADEIESNRDTWIDDWTTQVVRP